MLWQTQSRLTTGSYIQARQWIQKIWETEQTIDGIRYRSRLDNDRFCIGLFDRARPVLAEQNLGTLLDAHRHNLAQILTDYGYALL